MSTLSHPALSVRAETSRHPERPLVMGIVNVTPDSFSDGGRLTTAAEAIAWGHRLILEGADILDLGGESTRPGSRPVSAEQQWARIGEAVTALAAEGHCVSVDTRSAEVARRALAAGAAIVNDVSAGRHDPELLPVVAGHGAEVVLMHMQGDPQTMQNDPRYDDCTAEVTGFLQSRAAEAEALGMPRTRIWIDPGIGFGKTLDHNLELIRNLDTLVATGYRVLLGASRKSFIAQIAGAPPDLRLGGSLAALLPALAAGVHAVRVHDVQATRQFLEVAARLRAN